MKTKVTHIQIHSTIHKDSTLMIPQIPVIKAKLVLVECKPEEALFIQLPNVKLSLYYKKNGLIKGMGKYLKPILISETEKIEVGDWKYTISHDGSVEMNPVQIIAKCENPEQEIKGFKILALPEHFSPKYLQMIVNGELKEGDKRLIECECYSSSTSGNTGRIIEEGFHGDLFTIKLNSSNHIIIHEIKEKMISLTMLEKAFNAGMDSIEPIIKCQNWGDMESYPAKEIKYSFKEWFEQNIK